MMNEQARLFDDVSEVMKEYVERAEQAVDRLWRDLRPHVKLYEAEAYEVCGGLIARQASLSTQLAMSPGIWNGHIAPLVLRAMTDAHITLAWILREPVLRSKQYILHGLGQEKLSIAHLEQHVAAVTSPSEQVIALLEAKKAWLGNQRHDFLTEVNLGSWSGLNVREMAAEAGCDSMYRFAYTPFSAVVHSMWNHVSSYNLRHCTNPLHKWHRVPVMARTMLDPDFVYRSSKYLSQSFRSVELAYGLPIPEQTLRDWLASALNTVYGHDANSRDETTDFG